jgi:hypothetical protein
VHDEQLVDVQLQFVRQVRLYPDAHPEYVQYVSLQGHAPAVVCGTTKLTKRSASKPIDLAISLLVALTAVTLHSPQAHQQINP